MVDRNTHYKPVLQCEQSEQTKYKKSVAYRYTFSYRFGSHGSDAGRDGLCGSYGLLQKEKTFSVWLNPWIMEQKFPKGILLHGLILQSLH